jgi:hypothetical protein
MTLGMMMLTDGLTKSGLQLLMMSCKSLMVKQAKPPEFGPETLIFEGLLYLPTSMERISMLAACRLTVALSYTEVSARKCVYA